MSPEKFRNKVRKQLIKDFDGNLSNAARHFNMSQQTLHKAITGIQLMPTPVLDYMGFDLRKTVAYVKRVK